MLEYLGCYGDIHIVSGFPRRITSFYVSVCVCVCVFHRDEDCGNLTVELLTILEEVGALRGGGGLSYQWAVSVLLI